MPLPPHTPSDLARLCEQACLMEATARKPGNVHPGASFSDLTFQDFLDSAASAANPLSRSGIDGVGLAVFEAIRETRQRVGSNTNLGIALLLAPLAAVPVGRSLMEGIDEVLRGLTSQDATRVYEAIQLAHPGGMGKVSEGDLSAPPPHDLLWAMQLAADRDWIARQYSTGFSDLLQTAVPILVEWRPTTGWETRVIHLHLELMSRWPDTLIARKCGGDLAMESSRRAREVLDSDWPDSEIGWESLHRFDEWLRADGHRRNPGTTADAVAATLFAALRDGKTTFPDWEWPR